VQTGIHYAAPVHLQPAWRGLGRRGQFPNAERWFADRLSLPVCPYLAEPEQDAVIGSLRRALRHCAAAAA
jgi:dTDP-4-amino-4,6-dideoxygalactose transaminase